MKKRCSLNDVDKSRRDCSACSSSSRTNKVHRHDIMEQAAKKLFALHKSAWNWGDWCEECVRFVAETQRRFTKWKKKLIKLLVPREKDLCWKSTNWLLISTIKPSLCVHEWFNFLRFDVISGSKKKSFKLPRGAVWTCNKVHCLIYSCMARNIN